MNAANGQAKWSYMLGIDSSITMKKIFYAFVACIIAAATSCTKDSNTPSTDGIYFPQVRTIVQQNCVSCHYQGGQGMPVILTSDSDIVNSAAAIKSATIDPATLFNKRMPLEGELSDTDKTVIQNWFDKGGKETD